MADPSTRIPMPELMSTRPAALVPTKFPLIATSVFPTATRIPYAPAGMFLIARPRMIVALAWTSRMAAPEECPDPSISMRMFALVVASVWMLLSVAMNCV
jgi:hypothetical protein